MPLTFKAGIHPDYQKKHTAEKPSEIMPVPEVLYIPVAQHIGVPAVPVVKKGDTVLLGQVIASSEAAVSARIHSPVSGTVRDIVMHPYPGGIEAETIVIENDFNDTLSPDVKAYGKHIDEITADDLVEIAKNSGIVGMGGAGFPAAVKVSSAVGKIDTLLINGAECEPFLTSDHRLMCEQAEEVLFGVELLRKGLSLPAASICIEDNKKDAIKAIAEAAEKYIGIDVKVLKTKYPQGSEKHIIKAVTGRVVKSGKLPVDAGVLVMNVDSAASFARGFRDGIPVYRRYVTVSGEGIETPKNLIVRIGTKLSEIIEFCGGFKGDPMKIIIGGPMMGTAQFTTEVPVIKTTSGILVFTDKSASGKEQGNCIRCGRCVRACPMFLEPCYLYRFAVSEDLDKADRYGMLDCIECGSCSYVCPARINLISQIRVSKAHLNKQRKEMAEKEKQRKENI